MLEGTLEMLVGTETVRATAGTCVHVPAGSVHKFSNPGPGAVRFSQIVSPGSLLTMIEEISALLQAGIQDRDQIAAVFWRHNTEVVASRRKRSPHRLSRHLAGRRWCLETS